MSWLAIVFWLITHATDIIGLIKQFLDLIHGLPLGQREGIRAVLSERIRNGDVAGAKDVVRSTCSGIGCGPQLIRE